MDVDCFFVRQPSTPVEVERALNAVSASCLGAVRYAGWDPAILRELRKRGLWEQCDSPRWLKFLVSLLPVE